MKVLFTKSGIRQEVLRWLPQEITAEFTDVLRISPLPAQPFPLGNYSLIFTSINGVRAFFESGFVPCEDFTEVASFNKIYAVGLKTKKELRGYGFGTYKVSRHASELARFITEHSASEKFLHFCGILALDIFDRKLPLQNISYRKLPIYQTELLYPKLRESYDAVCFFSPSGVRSFAKFNSLEDITLFSIGETTERELKKHISAPVFTSKESNLEDLLQLIRSHHANAGLQ